MFLSLVRIAGKSMILVLIIFCLSSCVGTETGESMDWLLTKGRYPAKIEIKNNDKDLVMTNGLIERSFRLLPNAATVGFVNRMTGESILRGIKPEAVLGLDGQTYNVGGLIGQVEYAYLLPKWLDSMTSEDDVWQSAVWTALPAL